ncbi:MAG: MerR family transcriptional regulator [Clostridiaceae bacterium]
MQSYRTSEVAKIIGVHPNTILAYEKWGYISTVPRSDNGYRVYSEMHIKQIKITRLALMSKAVKTYMIFEVRGILKAVAKGNLKKALSLSENFLVQLQNEKAREYEVIIEMKKVLKDYIADKRSISLKRSEAAKVIGVSIDVIINWERNGMLEIPRNNKNNYRVYSEYELVLLKIIKILRDENYCTQCVGKMIKKIEDSNFELLKENDQLLSTIEEKEEDIKKINSHLSLLINKG